MSSARAYIVDHIATKVTGGFKALCDIKISIGQLSYSIKLVRATGFEPVRINPRDFKSRASANFATPALDKANITKFGL